MKDVTFVVIKALNGGLFVVVFAAAAEVLKPRRFAGLLSAAPSVALANLIVIIVAKGQPAGLENSRGMLVGAIAFTVAAVCGVVLVRHLGALRGAVGICLAWLLMAVSGYLAFLS